MVQHDFDKVYEGETKKKYCKNRFLSIKKSLSSKRFYDKNNTFIVAKLCPKLFVGGRKEKPIKRV